MRMYAPVVDSPFDSQGQTLFCLSVYKGPSPIHCFSTISIFCVLHQSAMIPSFCVFERLKPTTRVFIRSLLSGLHATLFT